MSTHESPSSAEPSSNVEEDIEEGRGEYQPGGFHPVYVGDLYHGRYEVLSKIGYGAYSTVWLVRNREEQSVLLVMSNTRTPCS